MKTVIVILLLLGMIIPANALDITAPPVTGEAQEIMPAETPSFGEGLWYMLKSAIGLLRPDLADSYKICISVIAMAMLTSVIGNIQSKVSSLVDLACVIGISAILLENANVMVRGTATAVEELSSYGNLLLPVMTTAVAAQGGGASSVALYTGTVFFDSLLATVISSVLVPMVYVFLVLVVANSALSENGLAQLRDFSKWLVSWTLKTVLYIFTGYMSITGVIAGGADKTALKATKLTLSGVVPVVGGIIADASETILVGAGVVKNVAGVYGMLALIAILVLPFVRVGIMYGLLKFTMALLSVFASKKSVTLVQGFADAMGLLMGMTGTVCLLFLISIVCFMKGMGG